MPRFLFFAVLVLLMTGTTLTLWLWPRSPYLPATEHQPSIERLSDNPLIHADLDASLQARAGPDDYVNISWPSLVRVPAWIDNPPGKYFLYFSHHKGDYIRLAYADDVTGPWKIYAPGALPLPASGFPTHPVKVDGLGRTLRDLWHNFSMFVIRDYLILNYQSSVLDQKIRMDRGIDSARYSKPHIASPEVVIDHKNQRLLMFYHGLEYGTRQLSRVAESSNGIDFTPLEGTIPSPYLRSFEYAGHYYLLGMPGVLFRAESAAGPYRPRRRSLFEPRMRHMGVRVEDSTLYVYWSRVGDAPESILLSTVDLSPTNWNRWKATAGIEVLRAEADWEGAAIPALPSVRGELSEEANELRDPYVFEDNDGQLYLLYVGRGEKAIGIARLQH